MRSEITDTRTLPVENLALNPSFERVVTGSTTLRKNYKHNPVPASLTGYQGANGAVITLVSSPNQAIEVITPISATQDSGISVIDRSTWQKGEKWTISFDITTITADTYRWTYTGGGMGTIPAGVPFSAGEKRRISHTFTVTAQANGVVYFVRTTPSASQTFHISNVLAERHPAALPYFDGSTTDNTGTSYAWEGAANGSASITRATTTEVMRNYFRDPGTRGNVAYSFGFWAGTGATGTQTIVDVSWSRSGKAIRATRTSAATSPETIGVTLAGMSLVTGTTYTLEYDIATNREASLGAIGGFAGANNAGWSVTTSSSATTTAPGSTSHIWATFVVGTGTDARLCAPWTTQVDTDWSEISHITVYAGTRQANFAYFDGSITPDNDLIPVWSGTENSSASSLRAPTPSNAVNLNSAHSIVSPQWSKSGVYSLRQIPYGLASTGAEGWTVVAGASSTLGGLGVSFTPGATYTVIARSRLTAPQALNTTTARMLQFVDGRVANDWGTVVSKGSTRAPNSAGETFHRITFTVRTNAVWALVRLSCGGGAGNGDVWWDQLAIIQGTYTGPYVDGDIPGCVWRGTPHDSVSVGYPPGA